MNLKGVGFLCPFMLDIILKDSVKVCKQKFINAKNPPQLKFFLNFEPPDSVVCDVQHCRTKFGDIVHATVLQISPWKRNSLKEKQSFRWPKDNTVLHFQLQSYKRVKSLGFFVQERKISTSNSVLWVYSVPRTIKREKGDCTCTVLYTVQIKRGGLNFLYRSVHHILLTCTIFK